MCIFKTKCLNSVKKSFGAVFRYLTRTFFFRAKKQIDWCFLQKCRVASKKWRGRYMFPVFISPCSSDFRFIYIRYFFGDYTAMSIYNSGIGMDMYVSSRFLSPNCIINFWLKILLISFQKQTSLIRWILFITCTSS